MKGDLKYPLVKAFLKLCCETLDHEEVKLQRSWLSWGVDLIPEHAQMWAEEDLAVEEEIDRHAQAFIDTEGDDLSMTADVEMVGEEKVEKTQEKGKGKEREKEIIALILKKTTSAASETAKTAEPGGPAKTVKVEKKEKSKSQAQLQIKWGLYTKPHIALDSNRSPPEVLLSSR